MKIMWYYKITFKDGTIKYRPHVSKKLAHAASEFCAYEMLMLDIQAVEIGVMINDR